MYKGTKILMLFLLISCTNVLSQHLSHQVLVPAAGIAVSGSLNYSQTVGETAIEIISCSGYVFTQGFQQPLIKIIPDGNKPPGNGVDVFPNPVTDYFKIKFFGESPRKFKIDIITIAGMIMSTAEIHFIEPYYHIQQVDVGNFKRGFYFVRVMSEDGLINRVFKIEII